MCESLTKICPAVASSVQHAESIVSYVKKLENSETYLFDFGNAYLICQELQSRFRTFTVDNWKQT
jgi:hypothetical protein